MALSDSCQPKMKRRATQMVGSKSWVHRGLVVLQVGLLVQSVLISADKPQDKADDLTGLHYDRYIRQVAEYLEKDPHFRAKLKNASKEDFEEGKLNKELNFVHHSIRSKLDELKREEINRLRTLLKARHNLADHKGLTMEQQSVIRQFEHVNYKNPVNFEAEDLDRLIKVTKKHLEKIDESHHEEFKKYEMQKEHERRERLKGLSEEERRKEEQRYEEMKKKHAEHPKINQPGSEDQLKEVWKETDGLEPETFNPKTFFKLHDTNGDGFIDELELEALFSKELDKLYNSDNKEDDMVEMEEERLRMREYVMKEIDVNKDRVISYTEFMESVKRSGYTNNEEWETIDQNPIYTEEELREYEQVIAKHQSNVSKRAAELQKQREELQRKEEELRAQKALLQQAVEEMEKVKAQS